MSNIILRNDNRIQELTFKTSKRPSDPIKSVKPGRMTNVRGIKTLLFTPFGRWKIPVPSDL